MKTANSIKVSTAGKGLHHWEDYLLEKQKRRLNKLLFELDIHHTKCKAVHNIFNKKVDRENIVALSVHPIAIFTYHLIHDDLEELLTSSTTYNHGNDS